MGELINVEDLRAKGFDIPRGQETNVQESQILNVVNTRGALKARKELSCLHTRVEPLPWMSEYLDTIKVEYLLVEDLGMSYLDIFKAYHKCLIDTAECPITIYLVMLSIYDMGLENDYQEYYPFIKRFVSDNPSFLKCQFNPDSIKSYIQGFGNDFSPAKSMTSKQFGERDSITLVLNDLEFYKWYNIKENQNSARAYFSKIIIVLYATRVKDSKTVYQHVQFRVFSQYAQFSSFARPTLNFQTSEVIIAMRGKQISQEFNFNNGILRYLLAYFDSCKRIRKDVKVDAFYNYAIIQTYQNHGMHVIKLIDAVREQFDITADKLPELFSKFEASRVIKQLDNYYKVKQALDFYSDNTQFEVDGQIFHCKFYQFARLFEGRCFLDASVSRNRALITAAISLLGPKWLGALQIYGLS